MRYLQICVLDLGQGFFFLCGKTGQIKIRYKLGGRLGNINEIVLNCFPGASSGDPLNEF